MGGDVNKALLVQIVPFVEEFLQSFDNLAYGVPNNKTPILSTPTSLDPSRAPEGKHTLFLYQYAPYHLKEGGAGRWDEIKQKVADSILETVRKHFPHLQVLTRVAGRPEAYELLDEGVEHVYRDGLDTALRLGVDVDGAGALFRFRALELDDIRIYHRALDATEVGGLATP